MKKKLIILIIIFIIAIPAVVFAHKGRTDSDGGHYDSSTGEYHYHHGYPAHQHINGICPYDYNDQTAYSTSNPSPTSTPSVTTYDSDDYYIYTSSDDYYNYIDDEKNEDKDKDEDEDDNVSAFSFLIFIFLFWIVFCSICGIFQIIIDFLKKIFSRKSKKEINNNNIQENSTNITTPKPKPIYSCPRCNGKLVIKTGKYGKFIGCSNYPYCKYTKSIKNKK